MWQIKLETWNLKHWYYFHKYTAGKIIIERITIFLRKHISKGAVDMKFSPDVGNNPSNPYIHTKKTKQISSEIKLRIIKRNDTGKKHWTHEEREGAKRHGKPDTSRNLSVIRKQSCALSVEINISWFSPNTYSTRMMKMKQGWQWSQTQPRKLSIGFRERK